MKKSNNIFESRIGCLALSATLFADEEKNRAHRASRALSGRKRKPQNRGLKRSLRHAPCAMRSPSAFTRSLSGPRVGPRAPRFGSAGVMTGLQVRWKCSSSASKCWPVRSIKSVLGSFQREVLEHNIRFATFFEICKICARLHGI